MHIMHVVHIHVLYIYVTASQHKKAQDERKRSLGTHRKRSREPKEQVQGETELWWLLGIPPTPRRRPCHDVVQSPADTPPLLGVLRLCLVSGCGNPRLSLLGDGEHIATRGNGDSPDGRGRRLSRRGGFGFSHGV